jgi:hypothetical protein
VKATCGDEGLSVVFVFFTQCWFLFSQNEEYFYFFGLEFNLLFNFNKRILFSQRTKVKYFPV